jgi:TonB family protein
MMAVFAYTPSSQVSAPLGYVAVELVAAPAVEKPAPPVVKPVPPAPVKPKKILLPAEPTTPKPKPKPVPKKVAKVVPPPPVPAPVPEQKYEDVLAQLRAESGANTPPLEVLAAAPAVAQPVGSPEGVAVSPEVMAWMRRAKMHMRKNWFVPTGFRTQYLETLVVVDLSPSGEVRGKPRVTRSSGNPWYDDTAVRAIQKSSPLPAPPEAGKWPMKFNSEDSY